MTPTPVTRRRDLTPCLLFPELVERGGGLARAVQERASLYARHYEHVVILTTSFSPKIDDVVAELKQRGTLDERVVVRNFFLHSSWVARLGVPPAAATTVLDPDTTVSRRQRMPGGRFLRVADRNVNEAQPRGYRYYDTAGQLLLSTKTSPGTKHEITATWAQPQPTPTTWGEILAEWVDEELEGLSRPVLFSLQRGLSDPALLASKNATRKIASLHNCHYIDPQDPTSGIRSNFAPLLAQTGAVDKIVCLTEQQRLELKQDAPGAVLRSIPYPGRPPREEPGPQDPLLVVFVAQLIDRKRVDDAIRAFALVTRSVPGARLEIYGSGPAAASLELLVDELGLRDSVTLMGYSLTVNRAQARAACTLMTSTYEGFARVISESMSLGTPVISYDVRYGPRDLIRDGVDGVLVTVHEPAALAEAIIGLLSDPARARAMGTRASEVLDRFPVDDFEDAWLEVVGRPAPRPERLLAAWRRHQYPKRLRRRVHRLVTSRVRPVQRRRTAQS